MNINAPIRKLLVSVNQCLIYNDRAQEAHIYEIKSRRLRTQKVVGTEKDDIGNLEDLLRVVNEECGNLKVVIGGGELTRKEEVTRFT